MSPDTRPIYLDCDTGIDDSVALALLLGSPTARLVGIGTVSGNTTAANAATNTLGLLALAGRTGIPVAIGEHDPRGGGYAGGAPDVHGANGMGDVALPRAGTPADGSAAELLIRLSHEHAGVLDVVAIAPLTNLARALDLDPTLPTRVRSLTIMGGAVWVPGNITTHAEANIANDPAAAEIVLGAGFATTLVPLDVTLQHHLTDADAATLRGRGTGLHAALGGMLTRYLDFYEGVGARSAPLHDPLAAAIATGDVAVTDSTATALSVLPDGDRAGRTIPTKVGATVRVVTGADPGASRTILGRILALTPDASDDTGSGETR